MDKQRKAQLLARLDELQDRLPGDALKAEFERLVRAKADEFARQASQDVSARMISEMSRKLDRFRADFDLRGVVGEVDALKDALAQMHEGMLAQLSERDGEAKATRDELEGMVRDAKAYLEGMTAREMAAFARKVDDLSGRMSLLDAEGSDGRRSLAATVAEVSARLDAVAGDFGNYRKGADEGSRGLASRLGLSEGAVSELRAAMAELRSDLMSRLQSTGGGSQPPEVRVAGSVMSLKYADINFRNGSGIMWTAADDDANKRVNITASVILAGGGGAGNPGGNDTEIQFNDGGSFGGGSVLTWNKNSSVLAVTGGVLVDTRDGIVEIANFGAAATDAGVRMNGGENIRSALFTEVNGSILSLGINVDQVGNRDTTKPGWIFRLDDRVSDPTIGDADNFVIKNVPAGGAETNRLVVQGTGSVLANGPVLPLTNGGASLGNDARGWSRVVLAGAGSQAVRLQAASTAGNWTMVLPGGGGSAGQYLLTDGNGITQWASVTAAGGSGITRSTSIITADTTGGTTASTDYVYFAQAGLRFTMPTAVGNNNLYTVKAPANSSVLVVASQGIEGAATALLGPSAAVDVRSDGSVWGIT